MAFDDFNRSNGGIGSNYTNAIGSGALIVSNEASGYINEERGSLRTAESYAADQYVEFTIGDFSAAGWVGAMLRTTGANSTRNGYMLDAGQNQTYYLSKYVNGVGTNFIEGTGIAWAEGDTFRAEVEGTVLRLYRNGNLVDSYDDTANTFTSGSPGLYFYSARTLDDATFGDLATYQYARPNSDIVTAGWSVV